MTDHPPTVEWEQGKDGRWRLFEYESSTQLMNWYGEGSGLGRRRLFLDPDGKVNTFASKEAGIEFMRQHRWGRWALGEMVDV